MRDRGLAARAGRERGGEADALAGRVAGGAPAAWPGSAWRRRVRGAPVRREGTPHLMTLAGLARIAVARARIYMIPPVDCAQVLRVKRFSVVHGNALIHSCDSAS
jgi:hypothetical protein